MNPHVQHLLVRASVDAEANGRDVTSLDMAIAFIDGDERYRRHRSDPLLDYVERRGLDFFLFMGIHAGLLSLMAKPEITQLTDLAGAHEGGLLGAPLRDTLKRADAGCHSTATEPREGRWRAFTPQMFRRGALARALALAAADGIVVSDEAMAMERTGVMPLLVEGSEDNIKVTTPADFALAEFLLGRTR